MSTTSRSTRAFTPTSLKWRLPLSMSALIVVFVAVFLWSSYHHVETALLASGSDRAQAAADQLSSLSAPAMRQRVSDEHRIAASAPLVSWLEGQPNADKNLAKAELSSLPAPAAQVVSLWNRDGERVLTVATPAAAESLLGVGTRPTGAPIVFEQQGDRVVFEEVVEVPPAGDSGQETAPLGYLTVRRSVTQSSSGSQALNRLLGGGARILLGGARTDYWSDTVSLVPAPPVERRAGARGVVTVHGEARIGALSEIAGTPWQVWVDFPRASIVAPAYVFLQEMGLFALGFVVVALIAGYAAAGWITRPLRELTEISEAIANGDYSRRVAADRTDEVGRLGQAFDAMVVQLQEAHREREERTTMLLQANRTLAEEMERRSHVEIDLRQAQKLESVGRLAAGVAHELNTPVQFVGDSVRFLQDAMRDLTSVLQHHRVLASGADADTTSARAKIAAAEEDADVGYLIDNIPKAIDRSLDGLDRIATIVRSMKEFAHPDHKDMRSVDLNQAIRSTLVVARNEYKYVADLDLDLDDIPRVTCFGSDVNQAVLNIVVNAAHAIEDAVQGTDQKGRISVRTRQDGDAVVISVTDTGGGISDAIRDRIFDPFFTTKDVGRGTGQGLAIARSVIVDKHGGDLTFSTRPGAGTTFVIRLPIAGKNPAGAAA